MELKPVLLQAQTLVSEDLAQYFGVYHNRVRDIPDPWAHRVITWLEDYCLRPGKAVRPLLVAIGAALSQGIFLEAAFDQPTVRQMMLVVELNHKRLLMADDVADRDELRHGGPAMHVFIEQELEKMPQYKNISESQRTHMARSYTEVAGIWLQEMITDILMSLEISEAQRQTVNQVFRRHTYDMTATGWYTLLDQNFLDLEAVSEAQFLEGLRLVTGEYTFVSPLLLGTTCGPRFVELQPAIESYGRNAGILFQISDDILGLFGEPAVTGKPVGNDLREGKKTLFVQYAYAALKADDKRRLRKILGNESIDDADVAWVQEQVRATGADKKTHQKAQEYLAAAVESLALFPEGEEREVLRQIANYIIGRTK